MKRSAFSLIELAIVLIIIGVLITGITQGGAMLRIAHLANARSATSHSPVPETKGLIAWYETSTKNSFPQGEVSNQSQLSSWFSISPDSIIEQKNTLIVSPSAAITYEAEGINKVPSVKFSGGDKFKLTNFYQGPLSQVTVFLVLSPDDITIKPIPFAAFGGSDEFYIKLAYDYIGLNAGSIANTEAITNPAIFEHGKNYIIAAYFNSTSSMAFLNDALNMAGNSNLSPGTNALDGLNIGSDQTTTYDFTGMISEIIIYNRPLKKNERIDIMRYLAKKYKIAVAGI